MRADRLLAILLILQARGRTTAARLSEELEVSVRTIYRDLDALSAAGVPVFADRGPGGGCALDRDYRTTLTGLTERELQALFALRVPMPLQQLGFGSTLQAALRKLSASLTASTRGVEESVRQRLYLDAAPWSGPEASPPFLLTVQQALWQNRQLDLIYLGPFDAAIQRQVSPLGLVSKADQWYLVSEVEGALRVIRVSRLVAVEVSPAAAVRPDGFELEQFWNRWCVTVNAQRDPYIVQVRINPALLSRLPSLLGRGATTWQAGAVDVDGWIRGELSFETLVEARTFLLGLGRAVEVVEPRALRWSLRDFARQIESLYQEKEGEEASPS
ncbi:MAG: WYL domain-containing protein [bacterium]